MNVAKVMNMGNYGAEIKDLEVSIAIDSVLLGFLSKVTDKKVHEVCFDLLDMSANVRKRLTKRDGMWSEDKSVKYPGMDVSLKIRAERQCDYAKHQIDYDKWRNRCIAETGHDVYVHASINWRNINPMPQHNHIDYQCVLVTFDVAKANIVTFSQTDLEHKMTEQFLLGME